MTIHAKLVRQNFDFLKTRYGFADLENGLGYVKDDLEIEFYIGNGQVDVDFYMRRDDEIFRPHISRTFELVRTVSMLKKDSFEPYPSEIQGYLTDAHSINLHLGYCARVLENYGKDILMGDYSIFEHIHGLRREKAKNAT